MTIFSRPLWPVACLPILAVALAPYPAISAAASASHDIIALPLTPTLPAGQRMCTARDASGLGHTMLRPASGAKPVAADFVLVNYIGYLASTGAVFDQGIGQAFPVNGVIPGFSQGLQMLPKGAIARFCIPAAMGYGAQGSGPIPANADLVFQVELVDFKTAADIEAMRQAGADEPPAPSDAAERPR